MKEAPLIEVDDLSVHFGSKSEPLCAVDQISFTIGREETVALVGESGCGKSMTALSLARLIPMAGRIAGGSILYDKVNVLWKNDRELQQLRGNEIAYIFQEPGVSLNPVFRIGDQIAEAIRQHRKSAHIKKDVIDLLDKVGISDPANRARAYPHELSGGMQQRVMIAMALACRPRLLVADEPTTALDVTIQAQILELLKDLQREMSMSVLLITHNLGLVSELAHRIYVMYAGRIVESGPARNVLSAPHHPYTAGLIRAIPRLDRATERLDGIPGSVPHLSDMPTGCKFHPRCPYRQGDCVQHEPTLEADEDQHEYRCYYPLNTA